MPGIRKNAISQALDVAGSTLLEDNRSYTLLEGVIGKILTSGADGQCTAPTTFTAASGAFTAASIGNFIRITGSGAGNNGEHLITGYTNATTVTLGQSVLVNEGPGLAWSESKAYSLEDDLNYARTDRSAIKGVSYTAAVPTYTDPTATGTPKTASLANIAGNTLDAKTEVRTVKELNVYMRPSINDTDGITLAADETFSTTDFYFFANDVGSFITISGSAQGANGTYRITAVTDGQTVELEGLNPTAGEVGLTWQLLGDRKAILSSRPHADSTDRRGIPIADAGAYDQLNYDATFADVIDEVELGGFTSYAGLPVWARQYAASLAPAEAPEGVFFVVQFKTGVNDGTASTRTWEIEAGRTGADGGVTAATKRITSATAAFTQTDVGKYIAIWSCASDNAGIYQIQTIVNATTVEVVRAAGNFVADANTGSLNWHITRYPIQIEVYFGDRYTLTALSETAHRTTLVGGIVSDAELTEDIREIRAAVGIVDGDEDILNKLTNTGADFVWSDLLILHPTPTVVDALNELNTQIGDRQYTGSVLGDGDTITQSLQDLADAISSANSWRTIERLAAAIPAGTLHDLPAAAGSYKLDATDNGLYLWVFWRGVLRDPGTLVNNDDYDETSGNGGVGGVGQITPYSRINANDHISYIILNPGP